VRKRRFGAAALAAILGALAVATAATAAPNNNNSPKLRTAVTLAGIREHQAAFQAFADANGGNRLASTPGYEESADYVAEKAAAAGYDVSFQEFEFELVYDATPPVLQEISPISQTFVNGVEFQSMSYSGSGDVTAAVTAVDLLIPPVGGSNSGCEATDFAGFPAGSIALIQRGTCTFRLKAENAQAAGASAVIIFNEGNTPARSGIINGTLGPPQMTLPVVESTFAVGNQLSNGVTNGATGVTVHVEVDMFAAIVPTRNVIAESPGGDPSNTVVFGAHLDSVDTGPGINDNGSGSATILEVAEQMTKVSPRNKVRFIWFSAEEEGLIGSGEYVASLSPEELDDIALMLNFDMVGSPNFVRFVYDGDGSPTGTAGPPGSAAIEQVFTGYFAAQGLANEPTAFDGRSDYGPFIEAGVPAGGLFTGAEGTKTAAQAAIYGGLAGVAFDPCYHQACDTFAGSGAGPGSTPPGLGPVGLDQMSDAVAHAIITFASSTNVVNGVKGKGNFNTFAQINAQAAP